MSRIKTFFKNINYLTKHGLWDQRENDIVYLTKKILDDSCYEFGFDPLDGWKINILDQNETLGLIESNPKSFIRTGDGEIKLMMGMDQPFQKYEQEIAESLKESLRARRDDIYVGINRNYFIPLATREKSDFYRRYAFEYRMFYKTLLNMQNTYIDATFTSYPLGVLRNEKYDKIFERWRHLFLNKDIILVCGKGIMDSFKYDIFELARSKFIIDAPKINAWDQKDRIIRDIENYDKKDPIIVFALGMAGKAMIPILTDSGYMCWDVGHLAKYYNAYMNQLEGTEENIKRFYAPD